MSLFACPLIDDIQQSAESSGKRNWVFYAVISSFAFFALRLFAAASLPLSADEAYYRLWSLHLDFGYYDHPPMVAYLIALSRSFLGDNPLGVRFFAAFTPLALSFLALYLGRKYASERAAFSLTLAVNLIPAFHLGGVIMTPDAPLALFTSLAIAAGYSAFERKKVVFWLLAGLFFALGALAKISIFLLFAPILLFLFTLQGENRLAFLKGLGIASALCFGWLLPWLFWLGEHEWVSITFQMGRLAGGEHNPLIELPAFLGAQALLLSPGIFLLGALGVLSKNSREDAFLPKGFVFLWLIPFSLLALTALLTHPEAGWASFLFPAILFFAWRYSFYDEAEGALLPLALKRKLWGASLIVAGVLSILLYCWAFGLFGENAKLKKAKTIEKTAALFFRHADEAAWRAPIFADRYQTAALIALYWAEKNELPRLRAVIKKRESQFDIWERGAKPARLSDGFIWIGTPDERRPPPFTKERARYGLDCHWADERRPSLPWPNAYRLLYCKPMDARMVWPK